MKFNFKTIRSYLLISIAFVSVCFAASSTYYRRERTNTLGQIWLLENTGKVTQLNSLQFGDNEDSPTLPTATTGSQFSVKVPFYNGAAVSISTGMIVLSSTTNSTGIAYGTIGATLSTTTWIGVADGTVDSGSTGWMIVAGYANVLTTGTVIPGNLIVSTDSVAGYGGFIAGANTVFEGAVVGKAVQTGTASGGLTLVRLGN